MILRLPSFLLIINSLLIASCSSFSNSKEESDVLKSILGKEENLLRGIDLGYTPQQVKKLEKTGLTEDSGDYLFYEFYLDSSQTHPTSYTVSYSFENDLLYEMRVDIYLANAEEAQKIAENLKQHFTKRFQAPIEKSMLVWSIQKDQSSSKSLIELEDESIDYPYGKLSLTIHREEEVLM